MPEKALYPSFERAEQYRRLARDAVRRAESAPSPYFRLSYLSIAAGWRALADQTDHALQEWEEWQREFLHEQVGAPMHRHLETMIIHRHRNGAPAGRGAGRPLG